MRIPRRVVLPPGPLRRFRLPDAPAGADGPERPHPSRARLRLWAALVAFTALLYWLASWDWQSAARHFESRLTSSRASRARTNGPSEVSTAAAPTASPETLAAKQKSAPVSTQLPSKAPASKEPAMAQAQTGQRRRPALVLSGRRLRPVMKSSSMARPQPPPLSPFSTSGLAEARTAGDGTAGDDEDDPSSGL